MRIFLSLVVCLSAANSVYGEDLLALESQGVEELLALESRGLPPEPVKAPSSQIREISDIFSDADDKEWPVIQKERQNRQDADVSSQLSNDRIRAYFGEDAKPAYGERDPETGKVSLPNKKIQGRKGLSSNDNVRRIADEVAEPDDNEINPFQLFPPTFHDLLDIPIHDYGNGTTLNTYEKFKKRPKQPLVSSGYANTKFQGGFNQEDEGNGYEEHTPKRRRKKYRVTTSRPDAYDNYEEVRRPSKNKNRVTTPGYDTYENFEAERRPSKYNRRPSFERPEYPSDDGTSVRDEDDDYNKRNKNNYDQSFRRPVEEIISEDVPVYTPTQPPRMQAKRPSEDHFESFEDTRTYSRPYDGDRYPSKAKERKPEKPTTYRGESYYTTPSNDVRVGGEYPEEFLRERKTTPLPNKPVYDEDIIYDYDDERNTGDKSVYFHVTKPESNIRGTNSHGLPPHATKNSFISDGQHHSHGPQQNYNYQSSIVQKPPLFPRDNPGANLKSEMKRPIPQNIETGPTQGGFPSVFNSDSPFKNDKPVGNYEVRPNIRPNTYKPHQIVPGFPQPGYKRPFTPSEPIGFRPPILQKHSEPFFRQHPKEIFRNEGETSFLRPPRIEIRQDNRQPAPNREQSSRPLSSITSMFSSLFGRKAGRKRRSVDEELISLESKRAPTAFKLGRSDMENIEKLKGNETYQKDGLPPHFYYYPPGKTVPLLVVGPFDGDAPLVEGAELVHIEPIIGNKSDPENVAIKRVDIDEEENKSFLGLKRLPSLYSVLQRSSYGEESVHHIQAKQSSLRNGVVFPKKNLYPGIQTSRQPVEAVLDPVSSELSIPQNAGVVEEPNGDENVFSSVSTAVKSTAKKLNPLQLLRSSQKQGLKTTNGGTVDLSLIRPAKAGSIPDTPFSPPIHLIPLQKEEERINKNLATSSFILPVTPLSLPAETNQKNPSSSDNSPFTEEKPIPNPKPQLFPVNMPEIKSADVPAVKEKEEDIEALPSAERYVRIPVKTGFSRDGVYIIEASPVQEDFEERFDQQSSQPEFKDIQKGSIKQNPSLKIEQDKSLLFNNGKQGSLLQDSSPVQSSFPTVSIPNFQNSKLKQPDRAKASENILNSEKPKEQSSVNNKPPKSLLVNNRNQESLRQDSSQGQNPYEIVSTPNFQNAKLQQPDGVEYSGNIIKSEEPEKQLPEDNKPPLFPPGMPMPPLFSLSLNSASQSLPSKQGQPQERPQVINSNPLKRNRTSVFFPEGKQRHKSQASILSPQFDAQPVKALKVSHNRHPVYKPYAASTRQKLAALPPGVTPDPPKLQDLDAPFIPSPQVSISGFEYDDSENLDVQRANKREDSIQTSGKTTLPVMETGFVPIILN
ncbi:uncharacterized protein LOC136032216 [Artemia franciscana]|uniref:Uncharacterized protein n=1 Tax=Artemia franciscana TaxID=6661 RepID=A0AA88IFU9_ARTSF|nr:hypothetical protein QYM36_000775 [Artemia franciscana]